MFRTVTTEVRFVRSVVAGIKSFAAMVAESFVLRAARYLEQGEELAPDTIALLQRVVARMIDAARLRVEESERVHMEALREEERVRIRRDREADDLYQKLLKARKTFEAFGPGTSKRYVGLAPGLGAVEPQVLLRYAKDALSVLGRPVFQPPDVRDLSTDTLSPAQHVEEIRPAMEKLEATVDELEVKKRGTEIALKEKTQALEEQKETLVHGSRFHESLYVLAGERFHADRLRPTVARSVTPSPTVPLPDVPPGDGEEEPAVEEPTEGSDAASAAEETNAGLLG